MIKNNDKLLVTSIDCPSNTSISKIQNTMGFMEQILALIYLVFSSLGTLFVSFVLFGKIETKKQVSSSKKSPSSTKIQLSPEDEATFKKLEELVKKGIIKQHEMDQKMLMIFQKYAIPQKTPPKPKVVMVQAATPTRPIDRRQSLVPTTKVPKIRPPPDRRMSLIQQQRNALKPSPRIPEKKLVTSNTQKQR